MGSPTLCMAFTLRSATTGILSTLVSDTSTLLFKRSWEEGTPEAFVTNYPAGKFLELDGNNGIEE